MKYLILVVVLFSLYGCAAGAATAGYALKASTADQLAPESRKSIIEEVKGWVSDNFQKKETK